MRSGLKEGTEKRSQLFVISVANQKGGVGKTTTVISLAGAFAKLNKNVLIIDLDMQANLTITLGFNPQKINRSISDVLFNSASLVSVSRETKISGIDLIPANMEMELIDRFLPLRPDYKNILSNSLVEYENKMYGNSMNPTDMPGNWPTGSYYDYLIMDCPPSIGPITINALRASQLLIIPTQPEYYSTYAIHGMLNNIEEVRKQHNPLLNFRLLITMCDRRNRIHIRLSERLRENFKQLLFNTQIGVDTQLRESCLAGLPITHYRARSRSALQYKNLAEEIEEFKRVTV